MVKLLLLLILLFIIYLHVFGNNYYIVTIFLIKVGPFMFLMLLLSGNILFLVYFLFHSVYRLFIHDFYKYRIPTQINISYIYEMNQNSTKFINYHLLNLPKINKQENYIYLYSPHALYAHGFLHLFGSFNGILEQPIISLVHRFFFITPFLGDLFDNCGFMECNYKNLNELLVRKKSVGLIPGGLEEAINTKQNKETIFINRRKGIFELSIKHKTPIVPIMAIGESDFYSYPHLSKKITSKIIRLFLYTLSWGKLFIPWKCQKNNIHIMFGEPIYPSDRDSWSILKEKYISSLKNLHMKLNDETNQQRELVIL